MHTLGGEKAIEEIRPGDEVWSYNLESERWEIGAVSRTFTHSYEGELVTVAYEGGSVTSTGNHPFWVVSGSDLGSRPVPEEAGSFRWTGHGAWVCAKDLQEGDVLLPRQGERGTITVSSLNFKKSRENVYNFEVLRLHNYRISNIGILVHNSCSPSQGGEAGGSTSNRAEGTHKELQDQGANDSHHVIQNASALDLPGYDPKEAPTVQLDGPSTRAGSERYNATQVQRQAGGGTYGAERRIGYKALRKAGLSQEESRRHIKRADDYFMGKLRVKKDTKMRKVGNRKKKKNR